MKDRLTQQDVDVIFASAKAKAVAPTEQKPPRFDFGRADRLGRSHVRALQAMHETFARNLAASLSAYLRTNLTIALIAVEQMSYGEFTDGLAQPTSLISVGLQPFAGSGLIEMNQQLVFTMLEILLGGKAKEAAAVRRDVTDIEQSLIEVLYRIVLQDLREAWREIAPMEFRIEGMASEPQALRVAVPGEPMVAIGFEVRLGEQIATMNLAFPSVVVRTMGQKFDLGAAPADAEPAEERQQRTLTVMRHCSVELDAQLAGLKLRVSDLLELDEGDVLQLDYPVGQAVSCAINGTAKFRGRLAGSRTKKAFLIEAMPEE